MIQGNTRSSLGRRLRSLRKQRGISSHELSRLFHEKYSSPGILKRERGEISLDKEYVKDFCRALRLTNSEKEKLLSVTDIFLMQFDAWRGIQKSVTQLHQEFFKRLINSDYYWTYDPWVISGLAQTEDYAYSVIRLFGLDHSSCKEGAALRCELFRNFLANLSKKKSPIVRVITNEHALYQIVGSSNIMIDQLDALQTLDRNPGIEHRIFPRSAEVPVPVGFGMNLFDSTSLTIETLIGAVHSADDRMISWTSGVFDLIWRSSVGKDAALQLIESAKSTIISRNG